MLKEWKKFGIEIPVEDFRVTKVIDHLKDSIILIEQKQFLIEKDFLKRYFDHQYIDRLFDDLSIESEIVKAYELVNEDGSFNRFNPAKQLKPWSDFRLIIMEHVNALLTAIDEVHNTVNKFVFVMGGGMHHGHHDQGRGFCLINDLYIGIRYFQENGKVKRVWVIDLDAHKGDGTAALAFGDKDIQTLSIHMKNGWPLVGRKYDEKGELYPWFIPSTIDIEIDLDQESLYLPKLEAGLNQLKDNYSLPDLCLVVAGADPWEFDELDSARAIKLNQSQMLERDLMTYHFLKNNKIPQIWTMAGGYGSRTWEIYDQFLQALARFK